MRWGTFGAGILIAAASTGRVVLVEGSEDVMGSGTWGLPGG